MRLGSVSSRLAFWFVVFSFAATMVGTTLPTPLYPLYEQRFGFGSATVTVVFATYAIGVLAALVVVGRASDTVGRRPMLAAAIGFAALSAAVFLIVGNASDGGLALLLLARLLSGMSAGIVTSTATATLADFARPGGQARASLVAALANIGGLGLGPLIAGLLARHAVAPLLTAYVVHLGLLVLAATAVAAVPEPVEVQRPRRLQVQRLYAPPEARSVLLQAGTAGFAGFAVLGLFTSVSPAVLGLLGHRDPALTGLVVFTVFAASAAGQLSSALLAPGRALLVGTGCLMLGMALVAASLWQSSLALLVVGGVVAGASQGLAFRAALGAVTGASPAEHRGAVASSFFAVCYVGISLPVVGVGIGAKEFGLVPTGEVFAGLVGVLSLAALVSLARSASLS